MKPGDLLLVVGVVMAPMTGLRIGKIGPAEVVIALWALLHLMPSSKAREPGRSTSQELRLLHPIGLFWLVFLTASTIGTIIGANYYPEQSIPSGLITWVYLAAVSLGLYEGLRAKSREQVDEILRLVAIIGTVVYSILYIYSVTVSTTILGMPLWYGGTARFSGGGTNPHQLAVLIAAVTFIHIRALKPGNALRNALHATLLVATLFLGSATESATLTISLAIGSATGILTLALDQIQDWRNRLVGLLLVASALILSARAVVDVSKWYIESDPNGPGRLDLLASVGDTFSSSPAFGLGPGVHSTGGVLEYVEYHNSYIEILAMSGIVGLSSYVFIHALLISRVLQDPWLLSTVASLMAYGMAGFSARRLVYWFFLVSVFVLVEKRTVSAGCPTNSQSIEVPLGSRDSSVIAASVVSRRRGNNQLSGS